MNTLAAARLARLLDFPSDDVRFLRGALGPKFGVKASGGIRNMATALAWVEAGATRLGASHGVAIVQPSDNGGGGVS